MPAVTSALAVLLLAAAPAPSGEALFKTYCASCHGVSARGDGVMSPYLRFRPADLTLIAKRRAGRFDADAVHGIVDGRAPVAPHGGTDMPVWGDAFKQSAERFSEKAVQQRIRALVDYLKTIQVK
ncbi:MAG TPA: cytochrome c [Vicinamibacteria bacterium]|nr:cytochrome c [Vicinamibacteria bacterium]